MRFRKWLIVAAFLLLAGGFQTSAFAMPRAGGGRGFARGIHSGYHVGFYGGFYPRRVFVGPAFGFGWGWGNPWYWGPYYYSEPYAVEVQRVNYGTVEFKVKPDSTKVFVDQKFIGTVNDLDHHKAYLPAGNHDIKLSAPDGRVIDRTLYVAAGQKIKIQEKL